MVEAKGRDYGVVKAGLNGWGETYWNAFGRPKCFTASSATVTKSTPLMVKAASPFMRGDAIKSLQEALNELGYDCGKADGIAGQNTLNGIRAFVKAHEKI